MIAHLVDGIFKGGLFDYGIDNDEDIRQSVGQGSEVVVGLLASSITLVS